jgi:ribosomal protein S18 acetylase RimI-like enzyme
LLAFNRKYTVHRHVLRGLAPLRSGFRIRLMDDLDIERILELRKVVRWSADPNAFDLLRGMREARWALAETHDGAVAGMVGAVPLGEIGILCHLAVHHDYRKMGLGVGLSAWAVSYLRSQGAQVVRLDATRQAEGLYSSLGFQSASRRFTYRLEGAPLRAWSQEAWGKRSTWSRSGRSCDSGLRVSPLVFEDLPELYGVDRWSFGADRSTLILSTLRLHPGWGLIARNASGRVNGYLIKSASGTRTRVGPFMAAEPSVARALLSYALQANGGTSSVEVSTPGEGQVQVLLEEFGFIGRQDRLRMELGKTPCTRGLQPYATTSYLAT